jgi:NAD(P)H-dependent FMN reductase
MAEQETNQIQVAALCGSLREHSFTAAALRTH